MPTAQRSTLAAACLAVALVLAAPAPAAAQYFGRNKVQYDDFDFRILTTPHFDIYYYPAELKAATEAGRMAERWYGRLSRLLNHELSSRQIVVLYASHPEFEQTNVIGGELDEGTGGVTEGARRRIVLPMAATLADSDHVLGHELVHAFQYDVLGPNIEGLPLWFIEGMAEYLSLGPRDAQTAMWLRDAAIEDRLPKLTDLDHPRYFPYRFGHALWAYVGGRSGDRMVGQILSAFRPTDAPTRSGGGDAISAIEAALGQSRDEISTAWHSAIRATYAVEPSPTPKGRAESGPVIFGERTGHSGLNVGPSLSPDGSRIAFLSARDLLSIDLFLADARTGRIERRLIRTAGDPHFESLQFLASAGAWSPDGRRLAVATVRKGRPALAIVGVDGGGDDEVRFAELGEIFHPNWSPDGRTIAFSAQVGGLTDLFVYDLTTRTTKRLTDDAFADLQPVWSPDGTRLLFVTDRFGGDLTALSFGNLGLATLGMTDGAISRVDTGLDARRVISPQWAADGRTVFFVAESGGRSNVYRLDLATGRSQQLTDVPTGVAGITPTSPALSVASNGTRFAVSVFRDSGYEIRLLEPAQLSGEGIQSSNRDDAVLPPSRRADSEVAEELRNPRRDLPAATVFGQTKYRSRFGLSGIGQQVGVASSGAFGTYLSGGIAFEFSDILGNHLLGTSVDVNGEFRDVGGSMAYLNRKSRWNWGVYGEHVPLLSGAVGSAYADINGETVIVETTDLVRQTSTGGGAFVAYPFSRTARVEFGASASRIGFSREIETRVFDPITGDFLGEQTQDLASPDALRLVDVSAAFVRDTASFGATGPVIGERIRVEIAPTGGDLRMTNLTLDFRHYAMPVRPLTLALRALHNGRYGASSEDERLMPLFLGYGALVRGYDVNSFEDGDCTPTLLSPCVEFDRLIGSRVAVINAEARIPVGGLFTGRMDYGPIPVELFTFFDAGVAWTRNIRPAFAGGTREWVRSVGGGARINALGFAIVELNLVRPLDRNGRGWMFAFNLRPGF